MCYLLLFRNVWKLALLQHKFRYYMKIPACFLRSRKYGTKATKSHLLAHHLTDPVLQLLEQIRLLLVHMYMLHFSVTSIKSWLKMYGNVRLTAPAQSSKVTACKSWHRRMGDHQPINAAWIHFSTYRFAVHTAQVLCCFPPIIPHWSPLVTTSEDSLEVCKFYTPSFSLKSRPFLPFNWIGRSGLPQKVWVLI